MTPRYRDLSISPVGWGVDRRLACVALGIAGLWLAVGWALDWWS